MVIIEGIIVWIIIFYLFSKFKNNNNKVVRSSWDDDKYDDKYDDNNVDDYIIETTKKDAAPYVELYEAIKKSKRTGETVKYRYGTYVNDGELYSKKGEKIRDKDAYFTVAEKRYQDKHGYDEEHMRKKKEHKKRVDEYLGR